MTEVCVIDDGGETSYAIDVGADFCHPSFIKTPMEIKEIFEKVPQFKCRSDDTMLCSFPKTGKIKLIFILLHLNLMLLKSITEMHFQLQNLWPFFRYTVKMH